MFQKLFYLILKPRTTGEDSQRREFILNVLLGSLVVLVFVAILLHVAVLISPNTDSTEYQNNSLPFLILLGIECFLLFLYGLSRWGFFRPVSYFLIAIFYTVSVYMGFHWGVDAQVSLLFFVLIIVMSGVLMGTRFALSSAVFSALVVLVLGYLQVSGKTHPNIYWKTTEMQISDVVMFSMIFLIIAAVSWLSNREIDKSLARARRSEGELKHERDMLEVRVIERTEELRKAEVEKMTQAYRFVEFGRLASGLFHDLMNPLSALSLNIENIANSGKDATKMEELAEDVARAKQTTVHMQSLMDSMRKHLAREGTLEHFSLNGAIHDLIRVLEPYARSHKVTLGFDPAEELGYHGDAVHFTQVMTNLVSNAIESYPPYKKTDEKGKRTVLVTLSRDAGGIQITVRDQGAGISKENAEKIFEPFFSTKGQAQGLGIGLSLVKRIIEKELKGTVSLQSAPGEGSTFVLHFPA